MSEATIYSNSTLVTFINVFTVAPANQQRLVELWQRATDEVMRHLPGFVSAVIHRSLDGTKVVNYAQWESRAAFAAMFQHPDAMPYLRQLSELGTPGPVVSEVVSVHRHP